jgi:hypothetical protein
MSGKWIKSEDYADHIVWQNKKDKSITVEAHYEEPNEEDDLEGFWYIFPAKNGKGIPNSPFIERDKKDALNMIKKLKEMPVKKLKEVV